MTIRERVEEQEYRILSPLAAKSREAVRLRPEEPCPLRAAFQRDRDRILHSKAFRRLKHKTQVYISPGDHYRTRMTHSLEVSQISRTIARGLLLNEDLIEAVSLGHDVGHTPFGHAGEQAIRDIVGHFSHNLQSLRVLEQLERNGDGLNLTTLVQNAILGHTGSEPLLSLEGAVVKTADRIAYLCHDYDDGIRAGLISADDLPSVVTKVLGTRTSQMITVMVTDMIEQSAQKPTISQSSQIRDAMDEFRNYMFETVYCAPALQPDREKAKFVLSRLYECYYSHPDRLPWDFQERREKWGLETVVVDYVAGLTDLYAVHLFEHFFIPSTWGGLAE